MLGLPTDSLERVQQEVVEEEGWRLRRPTCCVSPSPVPSCPAACGQDSLAPGACNSSRTCGAATQRPRPCRCVDSLDPTAPHSTGLSSLIDSRLSQLRLSVEPLAFSDCVTAEFGPTRLILRVANRQPPAGGFRFNVQIEAAVPGRACLPLHIGPIAVADRLPHPVRPAPWSRIVPMRGLKVPLRIHEAQDATSVIASSTWDPGVLMAAYLVTEVLKGPEGAVSDTPPTTLARLRELSQGEKLRCVEVGCGCGIAGLALAAACGNSQVLVTDGDARACALAKMNALENGLASHVDARELWWSERAGAEVERACEAIGGPPHLIVAADVVYREESFGALVATLAMLSDSGRGGSRAHAPADVLFAYRPRVEDSHFFHMLGEEFEITRIVAPAESATLLHAAITASLEHAAEPAAESSAELATSNSSGFDDSQAAVRGGVRHTVVSEPPTITQGVGAGNDACTAAPCMIYHLTRREVRLPSKCDICAQRRAVAASAKVAIAAAAHCRSKSMNAKPIVVQG